MRKPDAPLQYAMPHEFAPFRVGIATRRYLVATVRAAAPPPPRPQPAPVMEFFEVYEQSISICRAHDAGRVTSRGWSSRTSRASRPTIRPAAAERDRDDQSARARRADAMDRERADKKCAGRCTAFRC
jgi:hypothetical protein